MSMTQERSILFAAPLTDTVRRAAISMTGIDESGEARTIKGRRDSIASRFES
ncbi:MAG: hypothetical protein AB1631_28205 [Acidobacteriota bacterium]